MKKKIFIFSVGRSDYDRYYPIVDTLNNLREFQVYLLLSKSHYLKNLGDTFKSVDKKFKILKNSKKNVGKDLAERFALDLIYIRQNIKKYNPDLFIVLGDRYEMLAAPIAAASYQIPVVHLYGGAVTEGAALDELARHAITKLSHLHFVLHDKYKRRLINSLGEENWRVKTIGMHALNEMRNIELYKLQELKKKFNIKKESNFILVTFHPETLNLEKVKYQTKILFNTIKKLPFKFIVTYPNADPKNDLIINFLNNLKKQNKDFIILKNCGKKMYYSLIKYSKFLIGNTSSGIVEAASYKKPVVNLGIRQQGKIQPKNVISCKLTKKDINKSINKALSKKFTKKILKIKNPYEPTITLKNLINYMNRVIKNKKILKKKLNTL